MNLHTLGECPPTTAADTRPTWPQPRLPPLIVIDRLKEEGAQQRIGAVGGVLVATSQLGHCFLLINFLITKEYFPFAGVSALGGNLSTSTLPRMLGYVTD
jgi:hypothetical protein